MLIDPKIGQEVQIPHITKQAQREAILAPLREVKEPATGKCGKMFKMETRARFKA